MKTYFFCKEAKIENSIICLGDFDGIHKGHRKIFETADKNGEFGALLFGTNSKGEPSILTLEEKIEILKGLGARYVILADFEKEIKHKSPEEFVELLCGMKIRGVCVGYDYRFGYKAVGDVDKLKNLCQNKDLKVYAVDAVTENDEPIKSTKIRKLIKNGDMEEAARLLGIPYMITGKVVRGFENGRKLGFPTANIEVLPEKLLPPDGVYKGIVDGKRSIINIGKNPTFNAQNRTIEAHIIGFDGDLYGKNVIAQILKKVREEIKFDSMDGLTEQIKTDIKSVMEE